MTKEQIIKGNKAIADFMGWEKYDNVTYHFPNLYPMYNINDKQNTGTISEKIEYAQFHFNWSWLMPVLQKIFKTKIGDGIKTVDYAYLRTFGMINSETGGYMVRFDGYQLHEDLSLLPATYMAVVEVCESILKLKP